jgi:hypothetical protein
MYQECRRCNRSMLATHKFEGPFCNATTDGNSQQIRRTECFCCSKENSQAILTRLDFNGPRLASSGEDIGKPLRRHRTTP